MPRGKFAVAAIGAVVCAALLFVFLILSTPPAAGWKPKKVLIPKGSTTRDVVRLFHDAGVLRYPLAFRILVEATMMGKRLMYGEYVFPAPPSAFEIWEKMASGDVTKRTVTVPEGSNLYDIAKILADEDLCDPEEFLSAAASRAVMEKLEIPGKTAEGFLFPDTYIFVKPLTAEEIIERMARQFRRRFTREMASQAKASGLSIPEIVTIASIIEKETGVDEEKPVVSAIIRRRLSLKMPLQMDPTVIYGLKRFGEHLTRKDLQTPNPYNSYLNRGLPPGPIANPGLPSLSAALSPAETDYLYFVSRNDGSHRFSRTLQEHNRAVAMFRKGEAAE